MECSKTLIHVWGDNSWCFEEDLEDATSWKSDDYMTIEVPDEEVEDVDGWVERTRPQG